ncbi:MAG: PfkB family carbohydrate kinase [Pseudomonadota bacterium]
MAKILGVGNATLDIINRVDGYPAEDSENKALSQRMALGGNTANTLNVLSQLGHHCQFVGVLAYDAFGHAIREALGELGVSTGHCFATRGQTPTSYITLNERNGSRTIVHYRNLPELHSAHFTEEIDVTRYAWIHFQARANVDDVRAMAEHTRHTRQTHQVLSIEIEKPHEGVAALAPLADVLFCSKDYARHLGCESPEEMLALARQQGASDLIVCPWGTRGAVAEDAAGRRYSSPAFPPETVVDTVGAGDTFNAGFIDARCRGLDIEASLIHACRLAGKKVGQEGFEGVAGLAVPV